MQWNELNFPIGNILLHTFRHLYYYLFKNFGHTHFRIFNVLKSGFTGLKGNLVDLP